MTMNELNYYYNYLLEMGVDEYALEMITSINGYNLETLNDVSYYCFGEYLEEGEF